MTNSGGRNFHHPYEPYAIQNDFMNAVYNCLDQGKIGIFESPTGTGKSLSLICGSLTWLREHKNSNVDEDIASNDDEEPAWVLEHARAEKRRIAVQRQSELSRRLAKIRQKEDKARKRYEAGAPPTKKLKKEHESTGQDSENIFVLDDYESDGEIDSKASTTYSDATSISLETRALMEKLGMDITKEKGEDQGDDDLQDELKIFFCSRTHSQLSQFANELRKVKIPPAVPHDPGGEDSIDQGTDNLSEEARHLTLGSRKNLCINPKVSKLRNATAINERCLELQQSGTSAEHKCPFLPTKDNEVLVNDFRDHALARIRDIEDFSALGKKIGICPYYATRSAVKPTEIVTLPYPLLLQKSAREALNLSLKGHVIVVDEAHNLIDAIMALHSISISLAQLEKARANLGIYLQKFRNRLKGKNRVYITQLVRLIDSLSNFLVSKLQDSHPTEDQAHVSDLLSGKGVDQINLYKLMRYLHESKLAHKVEGYATLAVNSAIALSSNTNVTKESKSSTTMPVLMHVQSFLMALTNPAAEGRFFYAKKGGRNDAKDDALLKYLLLDPTHIFKEIVDEARAVILAGGTMSPMSDYTNHLFHYLPLERISLLSCGHVISPSSLYARAIPKGPNGIEFEFSFEKRNSKAMILELGQAIVSFAKEIPNGIVIFMPSYAYLDSALQLWRIEGDAEINSTSVWKQLSSQKQIFLEPRSTANAQSPPQEAVSRLDPDVPQDASPNKVDAVLAEYTAHIHAGKGALLFAVIGGSLSEGINFSDALGRGIAVVGLPYPNVQSPEWKARLEFVEQRSRSSDDAKLGGNSASREYYENVCMRAVNQSVGRAIRHKNDYASILLMDKRYERGNIRAKLPGWIRDSMARGDSFHDAIATLRDFFATKEEN